MPHLSFFALVHFYLPLALSDLLMTLQQPVVATALARTATPEEPLAAMTKEDVPLSNSVIQLNRPISDHCDHLSSPHYQSFPEP